MRLNRDLNSEELKNAARGGLIALKLQFADMKDEIDKATFELEILINECETLIASMEESIDGI